MARPLTAKRVLKARKTPGRYADGDVPGLYLQVTTPATRTSRGAASWVLRYEVAGKERMFGIGPLHTFSLKEARARAKLARQQLKDGIDPIDARKAAKAAAALEAAKAVTFQQAAAQYFESNRPKWTNERHAREFVGSLERYAFPVIGALPVSAIDIGLVLRVIEPLWQRIPETANRVRGRIEMILDFATVRKWRAGDNPARWGGNIEHVLPARTVAAIEHLAALPYAQMPDFMSRLRARAGVSERALEFCILTTARPGEVLRARWPEIDPVAAVWTVPPEHMKKRKSSKPHRVPLSKAAVALLEQLPDKSADGPVFVGSRPGEPLGKDALQRALARMGHADITVHGTARSTFRDWAAERTAFSYAARELALAHVVHSKQSRAYERTDLLDERRRLMEAWATFCYSPSAAGELVPMRKAARP
jgi:integrase